MVQWRPRNVSAPRLNSAVQSPAWGPQAVGHRISYSNTGATCFHNFISQSAASEKSLNLDGDWAACIAIKHSSPFDFGPIYMQLIHRAQSWWPPQCRPQGCSPSIAVAQLCKIRVSVFKSWLVSPGDSCSMPDIWSKVAAPNAAKLDGIPTASRAAWPATR